MTGGRDRGDDGDRSAFSEAMKGVKPLAGRDNVEPPPQARASAAAPAAPPEAPVQFEVTHTGERMEGRAPGIDRKHLRRLRSGEPHVGHLKVYSVGVAIAHVRRRNGYDVIHPMGYDAFGLPAENHAIRTGEHPRVSTERSIEEFRDQFKQWGISIDWTREVATDWPSYYRWTQWIFLRLFEQGLAYRNEAAVQWCPNDATVLANCELVCEANNTFSSSRFAGSLASKNWSRGKRQSDYEQSAYRRAKVRHSIDK